MSYLPDYKPPIPLYEIRMKEEEEKLKIVQAEIDSEMQIFLPRMLRICSPESGALYPPRLVKEE